MYWLILYKGQRDPAYALPTADQEQVFRPLLILGVFNSIGKLSSANSFQLSCVHFSAATAAWLKFGEVLALVWSQTKVRPFSNAVHYCKL